MHAAPLKGRVWAILLSAALLAGLLVALAGTRPAGASFPGTNGEIAFEKFNNGTGASDIYIMGANGGPPTKITSSGTAVGPAFSADGAKIAFHQRVNGGNEVYTMNPDGSSKIRLTRNSDDDDFASFSPGGNRIVFKSNRLGDGTNEPSGDPDNEIWVMDAAPESATNKPVRLTNNDASDADPNWSPDGKKVVFTSRRADPDGDIYIMNANGTNQRRITNSAAAEFTPEFSPNGAKIVFRSDRDGEAEIYTMNADGTGVKKLTNNSLIDWTPNWSPDGTKIVFARGSTSTGTNHEIYTMNATNGTGAQKLTADGLQDIYPAWQPR